MSHLLSERKVTVFPRRKVRGCNSVGMLILESPHYTKVHLLQTPAERGDPCKKKFFFYGGTSALDSSDIVNKPCQVRALSGADHLASVSNGLNTRLSETCCAGQHFISSLSFTTVLCLFYAHFST